MSKKKVAILNIYQGMEERGAEVLVERVAQGLSNDFDITMFTGGKLTKKPYKIVKVPGIGKVTPDVSGSLILRILHKFFLDPYSLQVFWFTLASLPKLIQNDFDIVFSINGFWQMVLLKLAKTFKKFKLVSTGFAGSGKDSYWNIKLTPDAFIAMTTAAKNWAVKINPKVKIVAIGGGVDLKRFSPDGAKAEVKLEKPIILCVAAFVPYKRIDLTIRAVSKMNAGLPVDKQGSLIVIGHGPEKENLEKLGNKLLGEKRFKLLQILYSEIEKYYRAADVFTLPSKSLEAFGIVYLEAMASGLPVVAPDDEIRREIVEKAGILIDVENLDDYAQALKETSEKKWDNTPQKQATKFSWQEIEKKYIQLFRTI